MREKGAKKMKKHLPETSPRTKYLLTWKTEAEVVSGSALDLFAEMLKFRTAMQEIVDEIWSWDKIVLNEVHKRFYNQLRTKYGFSAHQAKQIYKMAISVVKSSKANGGKKPIIRKLFLRYDKCDVQLDWNNQLLTVKLSNDKQIALKLKETKHLQRFKDRKWYEVHIKLVRGKIYVSVPVEFEYHPYKPKGWIAIDQNFDWTVLFYDGKVRRLKTRNNESLRRKLQAEAIQTKHPHTWRKKKFLQDIRGKHKRARNITIDDARNRAKYVVWLTLRKEYGLVLEDLAGMYFNVGQRKRQKTVKDKVARMGYREFTKQVIANAVKLNVPVVLVNPRGTSSYCPICGAKLKYHGRLAICPNCGMVADRDTVGAVNVWKRGTGLRLFPLRPGLGGAPLMRDEEAYPVFPRKDGRGTSDLRRCYHLLSVLMSR